MDKTLILITCTDKVGLVALISRILASHKLNIIAMREFVDTGSCTFFTRIECHGALDDCTEIYRELEEHLPAQASIIINPKKEKRLAIMVTREYHCLGDTLVRHFFNTLHANVCCVIGNYNDLEAFTTQFSIPFHHISHKDKTKEAFEGELLSVLSSYQPDFIVLAKFMRILSPRFIKEFPMRIINIHHSFLPAFVGAKPYKQAFDRGVKLLGATAHFVTNDLDEGPIIAQQTLHVNHTFGVADMVVSGKEIEKAVLSKALQLVLEDRVFVAGNKTIVFE